MRTGRLVALVVLTVVVQVVLFPHVRLAGRVPDLGLILAVAVAFDHGPEEGAIVGFVAGLGFDLFLSTPLGLTGLAYALTAYAVGVVQGGMLRAPRWFTPVIGLVGGIAGGLLFGRRRRRPREPRLRDRRARRDLRRPARTLRVHPRGRALA
jgi:rod shape-determining protein MreD